MLSSRVLFCFSSASELQGKTEDEIEMMKTMGFANFDTTKVKILVLNLANHFYASHSLGQAHRWFN